MIKICRPREAPEILLTKGKERCRQYINQGTIGGFEFDRNIYAHDSVTCLLHTAQYGKCCYCESLIDHVGYENIEHFRPKGGCRQSEVSSEKMMGYYWLAYDWDNLMISCPRCNTSHKRNFFPLENNGRRAGLPTSDLSSEQPLLIDPFRDDPADFIAFHAEVVFAINNNHKGRETIKALGLDRGPLEDRRREKWGLYKLLNQVIHTSEQQEGNVELLNAAREARQYINKVKDGSEEFSGMLRCYHYNAVSVSE